MTTPAIKVENLWKEYVVGSAEQMHSTFYDLLSHSLKAPFKRLRNLGGAADEENQFWALRDVNFEVQPGEVLGIIGRNGAGKSTLLKILSRITAPTRGRITVQGRMASLLEVGTGFHPELSGRENIFLNGALLGMSRADILRKFDAIVDFSEIEKFIDTPVKRYSSGMYMRLAFAVAAYLDPDILLIDEVLAVGDAEFQKKCLGQMEQSSKEGRTVIFVSHNMAAIQQLCGKALLMSSGSVIDIGQPGEVIDQYFKRGDANAGIVNLDVGALKLTSVDGNYHVVNSHQSVASVSFKFDCTKTVEDLLIDFSLENEKGQKLVHYMPQAREDRPLKATAGSVVEYTLEIDITRLVPGDYFGSITAFSARRDGDVLRQNNIPLFRVDALQGAPECMNENFNGMLIAGYSINLKLLQS